MTFKIEEYREEHSCPKCSKFAEIMGCEVQGVYDGICYWQCQNCQTNWHRFPVGHYNRSRVDRWLATLPEEEDNVN